MKKTIFLLVAIIAFLLPIGLTSCEDSSGSKEMSLTTIQNDVVLKTFLTSGNYPSKTLIASFNCSSNTGFTYNKLYEFDSINEPNTPIYNLILNTKFIDYNLNSYFKGRYNFTISCRNKGKYSELDEGGKIIWKPFYSIYDTPYNDKNFIEMLDFKNDKNLNVNINNSKTYRMDIFVQNK